MAKKVVHEALCEWTHPSSARRRGRRAVKRDVHVSSLANGRILDNVQGKVGVRTPKMAFLLNGDVQCFVPRIAP